MTSALLAATMILALGQAQPREITFHGCVTPGLDKGTYVLSSVTHIVSPDIGQIPEFAHGRRVLFWLDNDTDVKKYPGRMVEVQGRFTEVKESEVELKAGRQKDGGLVVEFEGPGKDVRVPNATAGASVGTGGRTNPEKDDVKTYLLRVDVKSVKATGSCQ
jgi:hypothetical protein